jgi:hypothetical protein
MLTLAIPQSDPLADRNSSALRMLSVKIALDRPCGTSLWIASASLERVVLEHVEDRRERLLLHDLRLRRHPDDRRLHELRAEIRPAAAAGDDLPAFRLDLIDRREHVGHRVGGDERPHQRRRRRAGPRSHLLVGADQPVHQLAGDLLLDDDPAGRGAALPGGADGAEEDGARREVEVRVLGDDDGVVAAELEDRAAEPRRHRRGDVFADLRRARERDERQPPVLPASARRSSCPVPIASVNTPWTPWSAITRLAMCCTATAQSGVGAAGFHITGSPQTAASALFHDHTATGS